MGLFNGLERFLEPKIEEPDLDLEQLPQLINLLGVKVEGDFTIYGPDGSSVVSGRGKPEIRTPLNKRVITWDFPKIDADSLREIAMHLVKCEEGESTFNPSPWERDGMSPGELSERKTESETPDRTSIEIESGMLNPVVHYLNPFFIQEIEGKRFEGITHFASFSMRRSITVISSTPARFRLDEGVIKVEGKNLIQVESNEWAQSKPVMKLWDLKNGLLNLECRYKHPISLYRIQPSCVIPLLIKYEDESIFMVLENFSSRVVISTFFVSGRITEACISDLNGNCVESINPDYDRLNIPLRRWGITPVKLKVRPLPEILLKKKIAH